MPRPGPKTTHKYGDRFKAAAVRLSQLPGMAVQEVAESLYIHPFMLSRWRKQAREGQIVTKGADVHKAVAAELKELRRIKRGHERHRPRVWPAISGILLTAALVFAAIVVRAASPESRVLNGYLSEHPQMRRATVSDCGDCSDEIEKIRRGDPPNWPAVPDYDLYEITADLNGDGEPDVAVVLIDTAKASWPFTLVIFNGPFRANRITPSFIQRNLDLRGGGLFFGPPRPKPYRLVVGAFESEGAVVEPMGEGYRWDVAEE